MTDIKTYWGVDSSPGTGWNPDGKCGNLFASMGVTGTLDTPLPAYSADIGDRATVPAGTHPTINTGAAIAPTTPRTPWTATPATQARAAQLGFKVLGTTYFDSFAALFGLPVANTASDKLSISFWISPDGAAQGSILTSPFRQISAVRDNRDDFGLAPSVGNPQLLDNWLTVGPYGGATIPQPSGIGSDPAHFLSWATAASGSLVLDQTAQGQITGAIKLSGSAVTVPNPGYTAGSDGIFYHVMFSMHTTSGRVYVTLAVNDTVILNGTSPVTPDLSASITSEPWVFPFGAFTPPGHYPATTVPALRDGASDAGTGSVSGSNVWAIGGAFPEFMTEGSQANILPEGDGLYGAVTELWIAEGQYIDFSVSGNRNKFHTTDILGSVYVPVDIGAHGETPTGTRPTIYCTGIPDDFIVNRANGVKLRTYKGTKNSLTLDGRYPGAL